jgi:hypothetical protein
MCTLTRWSPLEYGRYTTSAELNTTTGDSIGTKHRGCMRKILLAPAILKRNDNDDETKRRRPIHAASKRLLATPWSFRAKRGVPHQLSQINPRDDQIASTSEKKHALLVLANTISSKLTIALQLWQTRQMHAHFMGDSTRNLAPWNETHNQQIHTTK